MESDSGWPAAATMALIVAWGPASAEDPASAAGFGQDYFAAGMSVVLAEPVGGDALLAGGSVESNASVGGDATLAGGEVAVRATVGEDLYAAAGRVEVDALVAGNARLAGGEVRILPESRIEGGTTVAGGSVTATGSFGRYLTVAGGDVTIGGDIAGDVRVFANELRLAPGTRIGGELRYRTRGEPDLPPDVEVGGGIVREGDAGGTASRGPAATPADAAAREGIGWLWLAGLFALGVLLALGLGAFSRRTSAALGLQPWFGLGVGLAVFAGTPVVIFLLFVTLIGIPVALLVLLVYLAMLVGAYVVGALYLADRALSRLRSTATPLRRLGALFLVLLALGFLDVVPVLGNLAQFAVLLLGLGGIALVAWGGARGPLPPARRSDVPVAPPGLG